MLTPSPEASGTSALVANQELLEATRKLEQEATSAHEAAVADSKKAEGDKTQTATALAARKSELSSLEGAADKNEEAIATKRSEVKAAESDDQAAQEALAKAKTEEARAKQSLVDATRYREIIQAARDSARASTRAAIEGRGSFGTVRPTPRIHSKAVEQVARAVSGMVRAALEKNYIAENCMAFLLKPPPSDQKISVASADDRRVLLQKKNLYEGVLGGRQQ